MGKLRYDSECEKCRYCQNWVDYNADPRGLRYKACTFSPYWGKDIAGLHICPKKEKESKN